MGNKFITERAHFFSGFVVEQPRHTFGQIAHHAVGYRESRGKNNPGIVNHIGRQAPAVRQITARRGRFIIQHQRDARIFKG